MSQSVSRRGNSRTRSQNISRKGRVKKLELHKQHLDVWMISVLLINLSTLSSNNALVKMLKQQIEAYKRDLENLDTNEDVGENKTGYQFNEEIPQSDCILLSHCQDKEQTISSIIHNKCTSLPQYNTHLWFNIYQDITGNKANNLSNNSSISSVEKDDKDQSNSEFKDHLFAVRRSNLKPKFSTRLRESSSLLNNLSNNCNTTIYENDENLSNSDELTEISYTTTCSNIDTSSDSRNLETPYLNNNFSNNCYSSVDNDKKQSNDDLEDVIFPPKLPYLKVDDSTITKKEKLPVHSNQHIYKNLITSERNLFNAQKEKPKHSSDVFVNPVWRKSMTSYGLFVQQSEALIPLKLSTPYRITKDIIPVDILERQGYIKEMMCQGARKTDVYFHPKGRLEEGRIRLPKLYHNIPNIRKLTIPSSCCPGDKWQNEKTRCFYKSEPTVCPFDKPDKSKVVSKVIGKQRLKDGSIDDNNEKRINQREISCTDSNNFKFSIQYKDSLIALKKYPTRGIIKGTKMEDVLEPPIVHKLTFRDCNKPQNIYTQMKKSLPRLGKKRCVQPLMNFINNINRHG